MTIPSVLTILKEARENHGIVPAKYVPILEHSELADWMPFSQNKAHGGDGTLCLNDLIRLSRITRTLMKIPPDVLEHLINHAEKQMTLGEVLYDMVDNCRYWLQPRHYPLVLEDEEIASLKYGFYDNVHLSILPLGDVIRHFQSGGDPTPLPIKLVLQCIEILKARGEAEVAP